MSISDATENAILNLIFSATTWANYAINATSSPQSDIDVALHTGDPGDSGTMSTSETAYASYARVSVARSTGWSTSTTGSVSPNAAITFPAGTTGAGDTVSYFSTGKTGGGASAILWSGTVTPNISTGNGVTPQLSVATTITLA